MTQASSLAISTLKCSAGISFVSSSAVLKYTGHLLTLSNHINWLRRSRTGYKNGSLVFYVLKSDSTVKLHHITGLITHLPLAASVDLSTSSQY